MRCGDLVINQQPEATSVRLWHAIDHHRGKVLAYVFGRREE